MAGERLSPRHKKMVDDIISQAHNMQARDDSFYEIYDTVVNKAFRSGLAEGRKEVAGAAKTS